MLISKHHNYYHMLLLKEARVVKELKIIPGSVKAKGRMWEASAILLLPGYTVHLSASFFGNLSNCSEEEAAAQLNITHIADHTVSPIRLLYRASFGLVMLKDGIYASNEYDSDRCARMRAICGYNSAQYIGVPIEDELKQILELGYKKIISWEDSHDKVHSV